MKPLLFTRFSLLAGIVLGCAPMTWAQTGTAPDTPAQLNAQNVTLGEGAVVYRAGEQIFTLLLRANALSISGQKVTFAGKPGKQGLTLVQNAKLRLQLPGQAPRDIEAEVAVVFYRDKEQPPWTDNDFPALIAQAQAFAQERQLRLLPYRTISGRVLDEDGEPVAGALVLSAQSEKFSPVQTDAKGQFQIENLLAGKITLFAAKNHDFGRLENAENGVQITLKTVPAPPQDKARATRLLRDFSVARNGFVIFEAGLTDPQWYFSEVLKAGVAPDDFGAFCRLWLQTTDAAVLPANVDACLEKAALFQGADRQLWAFVDWFPWVAQHKPDAAREVVRTQSGALKPNPDAPRERDMMLLRALFVSSFGESLGLEKEAQAARQIVFLLCDQTKTTQNWWGWQIAAPWLAFAGAEPLNEFLAEAEFDDQRTFQLLVQVAPIVAGRDFASGQVLWNRLLELRESKAVRAHDASDAVKRGDESSSSDLLFLSVPDYALALSRRDMVGARDLAQKWGKDRAPLIEGAIARDLVRRGKREEGLAMFAQIAARPDTPVRVFQAWSQYEPEAARAAMLRQLQNPLRASSSASPTYPADFALAVSPLAPDWSRLALEWKAARARLEIESGALDPKEIDLRRYSLAFVAGAMAGLDWERSQDLIAQLAAQPETREKADYATALQVNMAMLSPEQRAQTPFGFYYSEGWLD